MRYAICLVQACSDCYTIILPPSLPLLHHHPTPFPSSATPHTLHKLYCFKHALHMLYCFKHALHMLYCFNIFQGSCENEMSTLWRRAKRSQSKLMSKWRGAAWFTVNSWSYVPLQCGSCMIHGQLMVICALTMYAHLHVVVVVIELYIMMNRTIFINELQFNWAIATGPSVCL